MLSHAHIDRSRPPGRRSNSWCTRLPSLELPLCPSLPLAAERSTLLSLPDASLVCAPLKRSCSASPVCEGAAPQGTPLPSHNCPHCSPDLQSSVRRPFQRVDYVVDRSTSRHCTLPACGGASRAIQRGTAPQPSTLLHNPAARGEARQAPPQSPASSRPTARANSARPSTRVPSLRISWSAMGTPPSSDLRASLAAKTCKQSMRLGHPSRLPSQYHCPPLLLPNSMRLFGPGAPWRLSATAK
jgi:hypothetical protein